MLFNANNFCNNPNLVYAIDCRGIGSVFNAEVGNGTILLQGTFDEVDWQQIQCFNGDNPYVPFGGLAKTKANQGALYCLDSSKLFSIRDGIVSLRLNFPESITNGTYTPLNELTQIALQDYVLWGVNFGSFYITKPGLYAALTPYGIEFTIISSTGKYPILDTITNVTANTDFVIEFMWTTSQEFDYGDEMMIFVNGIQTAHAYIVLPGAIDSSSSAEETPIVTDSFNNLKFYLLDTPSRTSGLVCILRRLESSSSESTINESSGS